MGCGPQGRPQTQIEFFDEYGEPFIRIAILEAMGWVVIRVSAEMLRRPEAMLQRVRRALRGRGCQL
jgi:very-short-patch-repair endonuclease